MTTPMTDYEIEMMSTNEKTVNGTVAKETKLFIPSQHPLGTRSCLSCSTSRLAMISIVCGISCVGIKALLLALQAKQEKDKGKCLVLSRRSRNLSVLSIVLWLGMLVCLPLLLVLLSYVLAKIE